MLQGWGDGFGTHPRHSISAGGGQGEGEYIHTYICTYVHMYMMLVKEGVHL